MAREGRVGLGLGDRLVLLLAWIATCGLVYVLGFYVGKGTQERRLGLEERVVRLPVTSPPPPEGQRPKSEDHFNFYEQLMPEHPVGERDAARPAAPVSVAEAPRPPAAQKPAVAPPGEDTPGPTPGKPAAAPPTRTVRVTTDAAVKPPAHAPAPPPPPALPPPTHAFGGAWTVLANPTRSREEADALLRQLRGRGYEAALVRVVRDGDTWYRVQVGRFATAEQASDTMHRLRDHEGVSHAFVASD